VRWRAIVAVAASLALAACSEAEPRSDERTRTSSGPGGGAETTAPATAGATGEATGPTGTTSGATGPTGTTGEETGRRERFAGRIDEIPSSLAAEMRGTTWEPGCPVPIEDLALLRFNYWGFDGEIKRGPLVVNATEAEDVLWAFGRLFEAGFPMKRVGLARAFHEKRWEEQPDSRRSVTASFNCRVAITPAGPSTTFSQHSYGLAIDINPMQNPYVRSDGWVRNRFARPYIDRSKDLEGMIHDGDVVVRTFAEIGWSWGGYWSGEKDYMHFSLTGQ